VYNFSDLSAFQDYVKRNLQFLKIHLNDISSKLDDLLSSRPKPCICTIQRIEETEDDQIQLPMDILDENMEKTLRDNFTRQQMVYWLLGVNITCLNHTSFVSRFLRWSELGEWHSKKLCIL
jgi:hypothetical protein